MATSEHWQKGPSLKDWDSGRNWITGPQIYEAMVRSWLWDQLGNAVQLQDDPGGRLGLITCGIHSADGILL